MKVNAPQVNDPVISVPNLTQLKNNQKKRFPLRLWNRSEPGRSSPNKVVFPAEGQLDGNVADMDIDAPINNLFVQFASNLWTLSRDTI